MKIPILRYNVNLSVLLAVIIIILMIHQIHKTANMNNDIFSSISFINEDKTYNEELKTISDVGESLDDIQNDSEENPPVEEELEKPDENVKEPDLIITDENILTTPVLERLKTLLNCKKKDYTLRKQKRGEYKVFENYVKASHGEIECYQDLTVATHGDFTFLKHLEILIQRWVGPVSMALYCPGTDLFSSTESIRYLRDCSPQKDLIRKWVTFHLYLPDAYFKNSIPKINQRYNCSVVPPYHKIDSNETFKNKHKLIYPINVGRNIAKEAALTHFILSLDVELYPSPHLAAQFLNMVAKKPKLITDGTQKVFAIKPFEIEIDEKMPKNKKELLKLYHDEKIVSFHDFFCQYCHRTPYSEEWIAQGQTRFMTITGVGQRQGEYYHWEAVFIGTNADPEFEESLSWDGMRDKLVQSYVLCVLDYDFHVLSNAFLIHSPGIRTSQDYPTRTEFVDKQNEYIDNVLKKKYDRKYGQQEGCVLC